MIKGNQINIYNFGVVIESYEEKIKENLLSLSVFQTWLYPYISGALHFPSFACRTTGGWGYFNW